MTGLLFDCYNINETINTNLLALKSLPPRSPESPKGVDNFPDEKIAQTPPRRADSRVSPKTKTVLFCSRVRIRRTISRHIMSPEEHDACWYHDDEYDEIYRENDETIQRFQESRVFDKDDDHYEDSYCLRGLEHASGHTLRRRQSLRKTCLTGVLEEQDDQKEEGIYDDEAIAKVYSKVSRKCRFRARVRGIRDHSEIQDYYFKLKDKQTQTCPSDFGDIVWQGQNTQNKHKHKHKHIKHKATTEGLIRKRAREVCPYNS